MRERLQCEIYTPQSFIDEVRERVGRVTGISGDNRMDTIPLGWWKDGTITEQELEKQLAFKHEVFRLTLPEYTLDQKISFVFQLVDPITSLRPSDFHEYERRFKEFERQWKTGEIDYSDEQILELLTKYDEDKKCKWKTSIS
jgi:hypothetical protein